MVFSPVLAAQRSGGDALRDWLHVDEVTLWVAPLWRRSANDIAVTHECCSGYASAWSSSSPGGDWRQPEEPGAETTAAIRR